MAKMSYSAKKAAQSKHAAAHPEEYVSLPSRENTTSAITEAPKAEVVGPLFAKVIIPMVLTEKCHNKTGQTADACFKVLLAEWAAGGKDAVQAKVNEWGVDFTIYTVDEKRQQQADGASNGIRVTHKQPAEVTFNGNYTEVHTIMEKLGADMAALKLKVETSEVLDEAKKVIEEAKRTIAEWEPIYNEAHAYITLAKKKCISFAQVDPQWQQWRKDLGDIAWTTMVLKYEDAMAEAKYPQQYQVMMSAKLNIKQAEGEIEAALVTIINLTGKEVN